MAARRADSSSARRRPQPRPAPEVAAPAGPPARTAIPRVPTATPPAQLAAAAGSAIVSAARVGRLLGRSGWRIARQLPGADTVEQGAQRLRHAAATEVVRLLELPQQLFSSASPEEERVMMLVRDADTDPEPLRTAMAELLDRSSRPSSDGHEYLFGTIVSQLVPDEARILAALAAGPAFAALDVTAKAGRAAPRTVLANASVVGVAARIVAPADTPTYLTRLDGFGLVDFGPADGVPANQFDALENDPGVSAARQRIDRGRLGSARTVRKTVTLSPLGREFWAACAPGSAEPSPRTAR